MAMDESLRELYQEVILDHSRHPHHFGALAAATHHGEGYNPLCGDRVKVYLRVDSEGRIELARERPCRIPKGLPATVPSSRA